MVGKKIKQLRKNKGYSISKLAEMADVSKSYISEIERGVQTNPSLQVINKISQSLDTSLEILLDHTNTHADQPEELDREWIELLKEAIEDGLEKEELKTCISYIKYHKFSKNQNES